MEWVQRQDFDCDNSESSSLSLRVQTPQSILQEYMEPLGFACFGASSKTFVVEGLSGSVMALGLPSLVRTWMIPSATSPATVQAGLHA